MKKLSASFFSLLFLSTIPVSGYSDDLAGENCVPGLNQEFRRLHSSEQINLCDTFSGRPLLIVNTASHCGYTPQFSALENIHRQYANEGLVVIGVPSNDFNQEAGSESKTARVCRINYGVTFTMLSPQRVKGDAALPLFKHLSDETQPPRWNFTKYLVSRDGVVTHQFGSEINPDSGQFRKAIESVL